MHPCFVRFRVSESSRNRVKRSGERPSQPHHFPRQYLCKKLKCNKFSVCIWIVAQQNEKKYDASHVMYRDGVYYYVRRIPCDLTRFYLVKRICFSLKTKSLKTANRSAASISQRLDDYWLRLRLQKRDIPVIHLTKQNENNNSAAPTLGHACDLYLRLKGIGKDKVFNRTAKRNTAYVIEVLGDRPLDTYSSSDASTFRYWLIGKGMTIKTVKRVFASFPAIVSLTI